MSLAPNGRRSNLTAQQYDLVRTIAFKKWFGDWENDPQNASKVVDENGEPMVCYHGTAEKFNIFKKADKIQSGWGIKEYGIYFSNSIVTAKEYSRERTSENKEYTDWCNKLDKLKKEHDWEGWNKLYVDGKDKIKPTPVSMVAKSGRIVECFLNIRKPFIKDANGKRWFSAFKNVIDISLSASNDGAICLNVIEVFNDIQNTYIAFNPNQIKLADGTNTSFDGSNNDIRFKQGGNMENKMTLAQIIEILDKSQITYSRKLSHIYGSEYWDVAELSYRLADHEKSEWRQSNRIEISLFEHDYKPFYEHLKSRKDIDLSDKSMFEKEYIALAKKTIVVREKDGLLQTTDGFLYENNEQGLTNAAKSMWLRKVYFPIKNKALNNFVEKESAKNRAREDIYGDGGNISKGFNYSIGGL